jgi:hypothetical protein
MCVMSPSAGTGAGGLHVEFCVPNENHRAYSVLLKNVTEEGTGTVTVFSY